MNRSFPAFFGLLRAALPAALVASLFATFGPFVPGCSSKSASGTATPACNQAKCASGNQCIDDGSGSGPTCHEACTAQSCPFGWYCNDGATQSPTAAQSGTPTSWCVQGTTPLTQTDGQWGTPCLPGGGEGNNKACDVGDSFACYGQTPTDANSFCTLFGCQADTDCPGGWWCATVDNAPNVGTTIRSFGATRTVCRPREYCATCLMDHDCPASAGGTQQHCVQTGGGADGGVTPGYCAPQCGSTADCALDAKCQSQWSVCTPAQGTSCKSDDDCPPTSGTYQHCDSGTCTPECGSAADCTGMSQQCTSLSACQPRAGTCKGAGDFCSPCRADSDCQANAYCLYADYSTERYCSAPMSAGTCPPDTTGMGYTINAPPKGDCPAAPSGSAASVAGKGAVGCTIAGAACTSAKTCKLGDSCVQGTCTSTAPANQCLALTSISDGNGGETSVVGCWTVNR
jgi:hypothetical protein